MDRSINTSFQNTQDHYDNCTSIGTSRVQIFLNVLLDVPDLGIGVVLPQSEKL